MVKNSLYITIFLSLCIFSEKYSWRQRRHRSKIKGNVCKQQWERGWKLPTWMASLGKNSESFSFWLYF